MSASTFNGTSEQQTLAAEVFRLMTAQATMFAADAPIKQTLSNLADFLAMQREVDRDSMAQKIDAALRENAQVFARTEHEGEVVYVTSRLGSYHPQQKDESHNFKQRLYEPDEPLPIDDISVVVSTSRPALTTVEPVFISDYWQQQAGLIPMTPAEMEELATAEPTSGASFESVEPEEAAELVEEPPVVEEEPGAVEWAAVEPALVEAIPTESIATPFVETTDEEAFVEALPEESVSAAVEEGVGVPAEVEAAEQPVVAEAPDVSGPAILFTLPDGTAINLNQPIPALMAAHRQSLEEAFIAQLDQDPLQRIVHFGRTLLPGSDLVNLGKNDLRRIRDYIVEVGEPLLDTAIIADLYYHSPRQSAYESFRFSLNYRLSREKDFEFVGVEGANLWSTRGLPVIGTKRVKASEMGHLTAYLVEGFDNSLEFQSAESLEQTGSLNRLLTFFEWEYGVLPLDASLAALLPEPLLPDQRSIVLRIESPQHYTNYLVEVRYPTGSRGGWLQGLEDFFHEYLVAGALITLARTEEPNVFTITYEEAAETNERLLILDEKKNKLAFANTTYYCVVDTDQLPSQQRFGRLRNLKSLPLSERRKGDSVMAHVFEVMGEQVGSRDAPLYLITMDDLYVAYNVLRPASRPYLQSLLEADEVYFADDSTPGAYYYKPEPVAVDEEDEAEEDLMLQEQYDDEDDF